MVLLSNPRNVGEVIGWRDRWRTVIAFVPLTLTLQDASVSLAVDGSASTRYLSGGSAGSSRPRSSLVEAVVRKWARFLGSVSCVGTLHILCFARGDEALQAKSLGRFIDAKQKKLQISGPVKQPWGQTRSTSPLGEVFCRAAFQQRAIGVVVEVTDGIAEDHQHIVPDGLQIGKYVASRQREFLTLVPVGLGVAVDKCRVKAIGEFQGMGLRMADRSKVEIWGYKLAADMQRLEEILFELVDGDTFSVKPAKFLMIRRARSRVQGFYRQC